MARVALAARPLACPGGSQWIIRLIRNADLDRGIEKNLDAALIQNRLHKSVKYAVKHAAVTLTGEVNTQTQRAMAEKVASQDPNVKQVVNELQVKNQKATASKGQ